MAHELTHVVQSRAGQQQGVAAQSAVSRPGDASEREADAVSQQVAAGASVSVEGVGGSALAGDWMDDALLGAKNVYHDVAEGVGLESADEAAAARLQAFRDHGMFGPRDLVPPTNIGGFEASYDPNAMLLDITIRGGVDFINGLSIDPASGTITANHTDLDQAAQDGNLLPDLASKQAFVADFTWSDQETWLSNLQSRVESAWEQDFIFQCTRDGWDELLAMTMVFVDMHEGAKGGDEHLQIKTYKVPDDGSYSVGAYVDGVAGDDTRAFDDNANNNEMVLSSTDVEDGPDVSSLLQWSVEFENDDATLTPNAKSSLDRFMVDFRDANNDLTNPVELVGRASTPGSEKHNSALAQQRIDSVWAYMSSKGFTSMNQRVTTRNAGETGAGEGDEWRRVDLVVCGGRGQFVAAHEFGHAFGLLDEYAVHPDPADPTGQATLGNISGSGLPTGTITGNDQMAKAIGASGSIAENNDNIMSLGGTVRPQHYATFGYALRTLSGVEEWQIQS